MYTALQKFGNTLENGILDYWHESFLICDNFALIRDKISTISSYYSSA